MTHRLHRWLLAAPPLWLVPDRGPRAAAESRRTRATPRQGAAAATLPPVADVKLERCERRPPSRRTSRAIRSASTSRRAAAKPAQRW